MATMNISLPDEMKDWVEQQASGDRYTSASDYVRDLIRKDQDGYYDREAKLAVLQEQVTEGIKSGISDRTVYDVWTEVSAKSGKPDGVGCGGANPSC